jgi:hypothetical protein
VNLQPGDRVTWRHDPRGGHGYVIPIAGEALRVIGKRVLIRVPLAAGGTAERWVTLDRLLVQRETT